MPVHKLYDEKRLIVDLQVDTISLIHGCKEVKPIKKLITCHDILDLTLQINERFPVAPPTPPHCDKAAMSELRYLTQELFVCHRMDLPNPKFLFYCDKVLKLLTIFQIGAQEK